MKKTLAIGLALTGFAFSAQAQLKVKLENGSNANNFTFDNGNVRVGPLGHFNYDLTISNEGVSRLAFMDQNFPENAVIEFNPNKQLRFQKWSSGVWLGTLMSMDLDAMRVGIKMEDPEEDLQVNGTVGIGKFSSDNRAGLRVSYIDANWGLTMFHHQRWGATTRFTRGGPVGATRQVEFGGDFGHFLNIFGHNDFPMISLATHNTSYILSPRFVIGDIAITHNRHLMEIDGNVGIRGGETLDIGNDSDTDSDGHLTISNSPQHKLSIIDYTENFYIRRGSPNSQSLGTVMGFQKDGSVTIGMGERHDGTVSGTGAHKLMVDGSILCKKLVVSNTVPNSDHVFEPDYKLRTLAEVEAFVKENKHLPEIPSAREFKENGYSVGEMDDLLLRKVEELTLYIIALEKEVQALKAEDK